MTRHSRAVALATALSFIAIAPTLCFPEEDAEPTFWVESPELELGTVVAGSVATATFVFHNDGPEDVHIIRAKPS